MYVKYVYYKLDEVISFLKNRDFSRFIFYSNETFAVIEAEETEEILIDGVNASAHEIPEETVTQVLEVLTHLDDCVKKAYAWISRLDFKNDRWMHGYADAELTEFRLNGISFEKTGKGFCPGKRIEGCCLGDTPKKGADGFSIDFNLEHDDVIFTVKFLCEDMRAYAIETWVR